MNRYKRTAPSAEVAWIPTATRAAAATPTPVAPTVKPVLPGAATAKPAVMPVVPVTPGAVRPVMPVTPEQWKHICKLGGWGGR